MQTSLQTRQEKRDEEIIVRAQEHCCYYLMFTQCVSKLFYPVVNILQKSCFRILLQKKQATILILSSLLDHNKHFEHNFGCVFVTVNNIFDAPTLFVSQVMFYSRFGMAEPHRSMILWLEHSSSKTKWCFKTFFFQVASTDPPACTEQKATTTNTQDNGITLDNNFCSVLFCFVGHREW